MRVIGTIAATASVVLLVGFSFAHAFPGAALIAIVLGGSWILLLHSGRSALWDTVLLAAVLLVAVPIAWNGAWLPAVIGVSLALYGWDASHTARVLPPDPERGDPHRRRFVLRYSVCSAVWLVAGCGLAVAGALIRFRIPFPVALALAVLLVGLAAGTFHELRSVRQSEPRKEEASPPDERDDFANVESSGRFTRPE